MTVLPPELKDADPQEALEKVTVRVKGLKNASSEVIRTEWTDIKTSSTIGELHESLVRSASRIEKLGVFQDVVFECHSGPERGKVDVTVVVKEKPRNRAVGVVFNKQGEPSANIEATVPYVFGGLASVSATANAAWSKNSQAHIQFFSPHLAGYLMNFNASARMDSSDYRSSSSFVEHVRAVGFSVGDGQRHRFSFENALRDVVPSVSAIAAASYDVMTSQFRDFKSSLAYRYVIDRRRYCDDSNFESGGWLFNGSCEYAGLLGDVKTLKSDFMLSAYLSLFHDLSLDFSVSGGLLRSLDKRQPPIQDRFFLGGTFASGFERLRGFEARGVGPCAKRVLLDPSAGDTAALGDKSVDHIGANGYAKTWLAANYSLKRLLDIDARLFGFVQLGSLFPSSLGSTLSSVRSEVLSGLRSSVGLGAAFPLGRNMALEFTYTRSLTGAETDVERNLQMGVSFVKLE